jgi:NAD(P)-dependent dehydrogenase (short-subunit alcohol dehydrogenase family)
MGVAVVTGGGRGFGREIARSLARRGHAVLVTDIDEEAARSTVDHLVGDGWAMRQDVRDPDSHREVARAAVERGRLEVWVNNAGVLRTDKAWVHADEDVRLMAEANFLGVIWGSRAAVDAMRAQSPEGYAVDDSASRAGGRRSARTRHVINMASMSAFGPVPGLAVYGATKHGVLGFTESLQGDLDAAGIPIRMHAVCPDAADTPMVREHVEDAEAAIIWSSGGLLTPEEVAERLVSLLDSRRIVLSIPPYRAGLARMTGIAPRAGLKLSGPLRWFGDRVRRRE